MHARALAAAVALFSLDDWTEFVDELPVSQLYFLHEVVEDRTWTRRMARVPVPAPVLVERSGEHADDILTAKEAATARKVHVDTIYAMVERGELVTLPRPPRGRIKIRRRDLAPDIDRRYIPPHDTRGRARPPLAARLDATPTRGRPQRDSDNRGALGARRPRSNAPRRGEPWAPNQGAWADPQGDPRPKGGGA